MASQKARSLQNDDRIKNQIEIKVGMIGANKAGKASMMVKYIDDEFDEDRLGEVNLFEKTIQMRNITVTFSVWHLGEAPDDLIQVVGSDAKVFLFVYDLTRKRTLYMIRKWYRMARKWNKLAIPFLIGTKFDLFDRKSMKFREEMTTLARKFANAMKAPLIYCSASHSINIKTIFQLIVANIFHLRPKVPEVKENSEPLVEYKSCWSKRAKREKKKDV